ncbi:sucrose-6-phosphate hydrolase [Photobacterium jeanii]|uniref:Sucrose-6-phosphate hydrolase n=1 Tax=Photobacterium jeanii TaxID=858640 RepID=A0A178K255_9GAMM|nr:glycoside hydrolase family 32 protein [Photobacterium jeanii]OAN11390.1 sucrose-6-phosphate hydrolase [Photobacterium jeanii]PST90911.1 sucrose-6-phosphate hydrolase [Photobacterium jeanii]
MQELKYKTIDLATKEDKQAFNKIRDNAKYRPLFHITPPHGLLNDPNGFCFYNNEYHLFYQWYPFNTFHGMKHWMHLTSVDLIHWNEHGAKITPVESYESHGAYSGAAFVEKNKAYLFYTGNVKQGLKRDANQCIALLDEDNKVNKFAGNPVIHSVPHGYTGHVRDPKILKRDNGYFMLLGAQREHDMKGTLLVYQSKDLFNWEVLGELEIQVSGEFPDAYMYECPDLLNVDGNDVLIFSPQGIEPQGHRFHNKFNVVYCIGQLNIETLSFTVNHWDELDRGFDFYAPQTLANAHDTVSNSETLIAWAGTDDELPSAEYGWINCLTLPRTLAVKEKRLYQYPTNLLVENKHCVKSKMNISDTSVLNSTLDVNPLSFIVEVNGDLFRNEIEFSLVSESGRKLQLNISGNSIKLSRENYDHHMIDWPYGNKRVCETDYDINDITFVCDQSIIEIFINKGRDVFTCLFFPEEEKHRLMLVNKKEIELDIKLTYLTK